MELRSTIFTVSAAACLLVSPLLSQQQASGRGGRGGGFTEPDPIDFNDHEGWASMFDGKTLNGWDGDKSFWRVEDGAIVAESTCEKPTGTIYLVWRGGEPADFEMKLEMKGEGAACNTAAQLPMRIAPAASFRRPREYVQAASPEAILRHSLRRRSGT